MRVVIGEAQRGPAASTGIVLGCLLLLTFTVFTGLPVLQIAPLLALLITASVAYRAALSWPALVGFLIVIILFIPIRRYTAAGHLPFQAEPYRIFVAILFAGWLLSLLADPRVKLRRSGLEGPLGLLVIACVGSIVFNSGRIHSFGVSSEVNKKITFLISFFLVFYLLVSVVTNRKDVDNVLKTFVGGGAILSVFALIEARTHYNVFNHLSGYIPLLKENADGVIAADALARGGRLRVYASAQHPIALGAALAMLVPLGVYLVHRTGQKRWWLATGLVTVAAFATVSRTAFVMLIVAGICFLRLRHISVRRLWPALIPALIAIHIALPGTLGTLKQSFFPQGGLVAQQRLDANTSGSGRVADLGPSLSEWSKHPLVGEGYGTRVVDGAHPNARILDDQWLGTLLEVGIVGFAAWAWLFVRFFRRLAREAKVDDTDRGWLLAAIAASVLSYAVGMFTYDALSFIQVTFLMWVLLGLGVVALNTAEGRGRGAVA
jgi:hypothetical protein